jgi:SAM-dependent methyltransferase
VPEPRTSADLPLPPDHLLQRIGLKGSKDVVAAFHRTGAQHRRLIERALPPDWSWKGKRVLDFGCGSGRVLRQFAAEAEEAEFWGCDLDRPSIAWLRENLSPPFRFFESSEQPDVPLEDGSFDLIYAFSVYTHFTDNWAAWMLEHHRLLDEGGLLFVTFLGEGMSEGLIGEPWDEDRVGMNTLLHGNPWDEGGPVAFNSPWWIRAHWGRAFEILELCPQVDDGEKIGHGYVLARKRPVSLSEEDLKRLEPDEPREIAALKHQVRQLVEETVRIRRGFEAQQGELEELRALRPLVERQQRELHEALSSRSWRLTAPLRALQNRRRG